MDEVPVRRLVLLRHAKSDWDDPTLDDRDRPLASRGRRDARLLADHVRAHGPAVELVVSSPARRCRETLDLVLEGFVPRPPVEFDERLYGASIQQLVSVVTETDPD